MSILDRTIVNIFNLPDLFTSKIPTYEDVFGVFVTIHRFKKLRNWPEDIHGCIGYWDNRYKKLSQQELYDKIMSVSKDAMFNDNRRFYFPSIENDPTSRIEISLMKQPLYKINIDGIINDLGVTFDNNKYGLIVDDVKGNRATFLPKVFENIDWKTIKKSIESKAGVKNNPSNTYYAYKTKSLDKEIFSLIFDMVFPDKLQNYPRKMLGLFQKIVDKNIDGSKIPNMVDLRGDVKSDQNDIFTNSSVISVYMYNKKKKLDKPLKDYFITTLIESQSELVIISILALFLEIGEDMKEYDKYISRIYKIIKLDGVGIVQKLEILIILIKYYSKMGVKNELKKVLNLALQTLGLVLKDQTRKMLDYVFTLKWYSKLLKVILLNNDDINNTKIIYDHAVVLMNAFLDIHILDQYIDDNIQTIYLAVTFEGMMPLIYVFSKLKKYEYLDCMPLTFKIFLELMKRYDPRMGVFKSLSIESKLDITCNVLCGFLYNQ